MTLHKEALGNTERRGPVDRDIEYGKDLAAARRQCGLTQAQLAREAGLSSGTVVARIENGERRAMRKARDGFEKVLNKYQEQAVKPRLLDLMQDLLALDGEIQAAGTEMPAAWASIMERVRVEASVVQGETRHVPVALKVPLSVYAKR